MYLLCPNASLRKAPRHSSDLLPRIEMGDQRNGDDASVLADWSLNRRKLPLKTAAEQV